jgi:hypothetical protein
MKDLTVEDIRKVAQMMITMQTSSCKLDFRPS